jgi:hypothetical protein
VKYALVVGVCGFACLVAAISGCSSKGSGKPSTTSTSPAPAPAPVTATANLPPGQAQVVIGGKDTGPAGDVECSSSASATTIAIGAGSTGVTIVVTEDAVPVLKSLGINDLGGVSLGYFDGGTDKVPVTTRNGDSYQITGAGSGTDTTNPTRIVNTTYDISVTCP